MDNLEQCPGTVETAVCDIFREGSSDPSFEDRIAGCRTGFEAAVAAGMQYVKVPSRVNLKKADLREPLVFAHRR